MKVKFWGARGSIPTPISPTIIEGKIRQALHGAKGVDLSTDEAIERYLQRLPPFIRTTIGGNTPCVEIRAGDQLLILDAGSGLRVLGVELLKTEFGKGQGRADFLITHRHWDHLQGMPFFTPGFIPGNRFTFHSPHVDLKAAFEGQQVETYFPVPFSALRSTMEFRRIPAETWTQIGEFRVYPLRMSHPGESYGYRIEHNGKSLVYATDSEYKNMDLSATQSYVDFFKDTDLLVFDAQYTLSDVLDKVDWGHSTPMMGAEFAYRANAKKLVLFHHDPLADDQAIYAGLKQAETYLTRRGYDCPVVVANEGLEIEL